MFLCGCAEINTDISFQTDMFTNLFCKEIKSPVEKNATLLQSSTFKWKLSAAKISHKQGNMLTPSALNICVNHRELSHLVVRGIDVSQF